MEALAVTVELGHLRGDVEADQHLAGLGGCQGLQRLAGGVGQRLQEGLGVVFDAGAACGGDTDTVAAITGAIAGAGGGAEAIPPQWLARLAESPRDVTWMKAVALRLAEVRANYIGQGGVPEPLVLYRNLKFLVVVLLHGLRRLLPPY